MYHDITPPHRIVATFEYEGMPGHVSLETVTLWENEAGTTRYVGISVFQSVADRDGMVQSGMEEGAREGMSRLAEVIRVLRERTEW
ncbi:Activator of Hsp90 ATPase homolog 1-like protein [Actinopolyspora mzabensis]|uniref:Activator of Hsp90 ATPase homolog 1-like protein n=1 Tax=Actinopolyspora mzabensis TaxID=995066 RepID=A0A1G8XTL2_ACTMZ|nr:SRPBCC domain-containing protein [Actinopolyspora mzabensis]SDJ93919.1 Activator of Hsp90 ATPase homolog 1-like protein [Actinopolyspora mzabensis]